MADNENTLLESLILPSQEEFLKGDTSPDHIVTDSRHQIFSRLSDFQVNGEFFDVTLVSSDKATFKAHKVILASASDYFYAMFTSPPLESSQNEVLLESLDEQALRRLLDFVYSGQVDLSTNTLHDLLDCAALYQLPSLLDECAAFMVKRVSFSNAAYLFSLADRYSLYSVREAFADLVRLHFTSFITDHCELFLALPASFLINVLECEKVWRQEKPAIAEEIVARAVLQWLEHRNADMKLVHRLLSCVRFGAVSSLALFELPEAIRSFRTRSLQSGSAHAALNASSSTSSTKNETATEDVLQQQQRSKSQLVAALRHLSSLFIMQDSTSPQTPSTAASTEFPASSPIRHLLALNAHSFLPRCTVSGVVAFMKSERTFHYYTLAPTTSATPSHSLATHSTSSSAHAGTSTSRRSAGNASIIMSSYLTPASASTPSHQLIPRMAPSFFFRMQPPQEFVLVGASSSRALNAFFLLHWHDASKHQFGDTGGLRYAYPTSVHSFDSQFGTPQLWAALDAAHYRTMLTACFPDKMALCFSSGRELLAIPRKGAAFIMLHDRAYLIGGQSDLCASLFADMVLEFCVHTRCWSRVPVFKRANSLASASSAFISLSTASSATLFGSSTAGVNTSSSQPPAAPLPNAIEARWEARRAEREQLRRSLRSLAQQLEMTPTPTPISTSSVQPSISLASTRSAFQPPESRTALEASLSSTKVREESPEGAEVAATSSFIGSISVSAPNDTVEELAALETERERATGPQSHEESGTDLFSTGAAPLVAAENSAQSSSSSAPKPKPKPSASANAPASQAVDVKPKQVVVPVEEEEEPDVGSTNLLPVLALMGQGVAAAANEREHIVFICGQMRSYTAPTNVFHLKNRCYHLRLVSSSSLYNHSKRAKLNLGAAGSVLPPGSAILRNHQQPIIPLSTKMDLSALPESESVFVLQRLPSMNVPRMNHQLLHYQSDSAGGYEFLIAVGGMAGRSMATNVSLASLDPYYEQRGRPVEFLDLQRLSLGWVLVETDPRFFILLGSAEHMFTLAGDSILVFGRHFPHAPNTSAYSFDIRYLIEQYAHLLREKDSPADSVASSPAELLMPSAQPQRPNIERPVKLRVEGERLWRPVTSLIDPPGYSFDSQLFFATPLPL